MEQRIDIVTLGVADLAAARRFYVDGLGWELSLEVPGEVVFLQVGPRAAAGAVRRAGARGRHRRRPLATGPAPVTLAQVLDSEAEVEAVLDRAAAVGATVLKPPQRAAFGGFHGYFADPAGFRWEVATNPGWSVAPDGRVTIVPIEP